MTEPDVLFSHHGATAHIILNRPKALNSLNRSMADAIAGKLAEWAESPSVEAVLIEGTGDRAFCAGGDVVAVAKAVRSGDSLTRDMFVSEYSMNHAIHHFPKPYIAFMDGIVMGGGCGLSVHGSHRIVTERTMLAMPETGIGFLPDVGATWFLNQCPGLTGLYLGLTGARISGADAIWAGLADYFMPSSRLDDLRAALLLAEDPATIVGEFAEPAEESELANRQPVIDRCFGAGTVEAILETLAADPDPLGAEIVAMMDGKSPTSLKLTHHLLTRSSEPTIEEALFWEFRASQGCMAGHDFAEGIRALLIDKDNSPNWQPNTLSDVTEAIIEAHLAEPAGGDLPLPPINGE